MATRVPTPHATASTRRRPMRRAAPAIAAIGAAALGACADVPPTAISGSAAPLRAATSAVGQPRRPKTVDDEYAEVAAQVRGFGGLYVDSAGAAQVYLTPEAALDAARPAVAALIRRLGLPAGTPVQFRQGRFDYLQLTAGYRAVKQVVGSDGFTQGDIDEVHNRIALGAADPTAAERVTARVQELGLPPGLVMVEVIPPTVTSAALQDVVRPVIGGLQIQAASGEVCTFGYNVRAEDIVYGTPVDGRYFVTNAHCTGDYGAFGGVTNVTIGQPTASSPIGYEVIDPPLIDGDADPDDACRPGRRCRYSDAALIRLNDNVQSSLGRIARVSGFNIVGSYQIDNVGSNYWSHITYTVAKVGRTTGYTQGQVTTSASTCLDVVQYRPIGNTSEDTGRDMLCQGQATYDTRGGDSGSPVFEVRSDAPNVNLFGINWGTGYSQYPSGGPIRGTFSYHSSVSEEIGGAMSYKRLIPY